MVDLQCSVELQDVLRERGCGVRIWVRVHHMCVVTFMFRFSSFVGNTSQLVSSFIITCQPALLKTFAALQRWKEEKDTNIKLWDRIDQINKTVDRMVRPLKKT